jgi:hypothetical protein
LTSKPGALVFLVTADPVPASSRAPSVFLALQIPVDRVPDDRNRASVLEELNVTLNDVSTEHRASALNDLNAAADA